MSALVMVVACDDKLASAAAVRLTLRSMATPSEISDAAEIKRDHQRRHHGEFDGGHAAPVAAKARQRPRQEAPSAGERGAGERAHHL